MERGIKIFNDLIDEGKIEYLDMNELNDCFIALDKGAIVLGKTTYMEIEVFTIFSASVLPLYLSRIVINHLVTLISALWENNKWA